MSKHTPGPWNLAFYTDSDVAIDVIAGTEHLTKSGARRAKWIANLDIDATECSFEELEANAWLIAAAPELLEALKLFCCAVPSGSYFAAADPNGIGPGIGKSCDEAKVKARAAIAKAEGRTNE